MEEKKERFNSDSLFLLVAFGIIIYGIAAISMLVLSSHAESKN